MAAGNRSVIGHSANSSRTVGEFGVVAEEFTLRYDDFGSSYKDVWILNA